MNWLIVLEKQIEMLQMFVFWGPIYGFEGGRIGTSIGLWRMLKIHLQCLFICLVSTKKWSIVAKFLNYWLITNLVVVVFHWFFGVYKCLHVKLRWIHACFEYKVGLERFSLPIFFPLLWLVGLNGKIAIFPGT